MSRFRSLMLCAVVMAAGTTTSCGDPEPPPARTYSMGEKITVGHLIYIVYETQWLTHLGEGGDSHVPQNRYFLVRLSVVNGANRDVIVPNFTIEDDTGKSYPELGGDQALGVPQFIGYLRKVRPADTSQGNALFDAPPRHYKLKVLDEDSDKAAYVDIPLSFTSESPDLPQVGAPEKEMPQIVPKK